MFERYTEKTRRVIFFARYEASQFGSPQIEAEHVLLGLLREDRAIARRLEQAGASMEFVRKQIEQRHPVRERISTSVDVPISEDCKRVLAHAEEEAERFSRRHIGTEHLLLGLLREETSLAAEILRERGFDLSKLRREFQEAPQEPSARGESPAEPRPARAEGTSLLSEFSRDLTQAAERKQLDPLFGRENELTRVAQILCRRSRNNPVLVGEPGVGKTAIVHGLAQRIAGANVPPRLAGRRLLALELSPLLAITRQSGQFEKRLTGFLNDLEDAPPTILYIEELFASGGTEGLPDVAGILRPLFSHGQLQCIGAATAAEYQGALEKQAWLEQYFQPVEVPPPNEAEAIDILLAIRGRYEQFHGVTYTEEALKHAVFYSQRFLPERHLPDIAIDLIDEAGAGAVLRRGALPEEVIDCEKRLKVILERKESAIGSPEQATLYSEEERKERGRLRQLKEKYQLGVKGTVTLDHIEAIVANWTGVPLATIRQERRDPEGDKERT